MNSTSSKQTQTVPNNSNNIYQQKIYDLNQQISNLRSQFPKDPFNFKQRIADFKAFQNKHQLANLSYNGQSFTWSELFTSYIFDQYIFYPYKGNFDNFTKFIISLDNQEQETFLKEIDQYIFLKRLNIKPQDKICLLGLKDFLEIYKGYIENKNNGQKHSLYINLYNTLYTYKAYSDENDFIRELYNKLKANRFYYIKNDATEVKISNEHNQINFHGLSIPLVSKLMEHINNNNGFNKINQIITGKGNNSINNTCITKEKVIEFLNNNNIEITNKSNEGVVYIKIRGLLNIENELSTSNNTESSVPMNTGLLDIGNENSSTPNNTESSVTMNTGLLSKKRKRDDSDNSDDNSSDNIPVDNNPVDSNSVDNSVVSPPQKKRKRLILGSRRNK
tara:strand:+ start:324 stop:1496 length:1173 start_codon:yes stop_codon:yes gene_type:complete